MTFHALGMNDLDGSYDPSNVDLARFGGTVPANFRLGRGGFTGMASEHYQFKTPQLYNLKDSPFYGHGASFQTVREVIEYKNKAIRENLLVPKAKLAPKFRPRGLAPSQIDALDAFISDALYDANLMRYFPVWPSRESTLDVRRRRRPHRYSAGRATPGAGSVGIRSSARLSCFRNPSPPVRFDTCQSSPIGVVCGHPFCLT